MGEQVPYKILVVDNEQTDLEVTKLLLSSDPDFEILTEMNADAAIELVRKRPNEFSAIVLDYHMPKDGLQTAQEMFAINSHLQIAILSADQTREALKKSIQIGVKSFIDKDEDGEVICGIVRSLCEKWKSKAEVFMGSSPDNDQNEELISSIGLVGRSPKLADVARMVKRAGKVDCSVIIQGESGTGKELIAKAIHNQSKRKHKPFVAINVSAIPENLAESELFGHVKGAFTGADQANAGKLMSANGGTLFLDEIGDLKPEIQVKLLRVIQERKVTPVGGNKVLELDVRIISATHVDLEKAIMDGKFREDLFYRLHVLPINLVPLRDRPEDIQPLIVHFLKHYKGSHIELLMKTVRLLERYQWKGNVRELENEIQKIVTLGLKTIEPLHLSKKILDSVNYDAVETFVSHHEYQRKTWETELEYLERNIRLAGSLREACRSIFKSAPSSIHTRLNSLKENITKSNQRGFENEQNI